MVGAVHEILISLLETTMHLTEVERGYVFLKDPAGNLQLSVGRNIRMEPLEDDSTISHSAIQQAIHSASDFIVTDTLSAEAGSPSASIVAQSLRTVICIPLRKRTSDPHSPLSEILGILYLDSRKQRQRMMRVDSDLLKTIAMEAAVLVENASLASAEESARRYREELGIAAAIQQGLMTVRIPEAVLRAGSRSQRSLQGDRRRFLRCHRHRQRALCCPRGHFWERSFRRVAGLHAAGTGACPGAGRGVAAADCHVLQQIHCEKSISKYATLILLKLSPDGLLNI